MVDACDKGKYRRGKGVVHSTKFLNEIMNEKINIDELEKYLESTKIVNVPNWSTHNMICGTQNNVWIAEPGRGIIHDVLKPNEFKVMTNISLVDNIQSKAMISCERYQITSKLLLKDINIKKAFEILESVKQSDGEWSTTFSMVYDRNQKTVYYCYDQDFNTLKEHHF